MNDSISRTQAIQVMMDEDVDHVQGISGREVIQILMDLTAAQSEIIRCKDCKWYGRADKRRFYRGMDCLQNRIDTIVPDKDFCSKAERREE